MTAATDLLNVQRKLEANTRRTARGIGKDVNRIALATVRPAVGADVALSSGGHRKPRKLRTKTRIESRGNVIPMVVVWGVPPGPWRWINDGTEPHEIRRRKRGPLSKLTVDHPGMRGFGSWDEAERIVARTVPAKFFDSVSDAVRSLGLG